MLVKCISKYQDLQLKRLVNVNEEIEVADARGVILINANVAEAVATPPTPEVVTKQAPKKKATAKKVVTNE